MNYTASMGEKQVYSLEQVAKMKNVYITPAQAAPVLGCTPYLINVMARDRETRERLGFPVIMVGSRVKIPRLPFLKALGWEVEA